ncbi:hypothetical protein EW026_g4762 [Hermanssonia centrifuga]|uniref:Uncharacterized protein n=1 Tax=Hermanssonia centrifuga TaxID=98765 RepID=A0A4S4KG76_9APHY|nr:hypothetical protein EW026_g4762 [Hermanssonia centrifuga]
MKPASCLSNTFSELGLQRIEAQYSLLLSRQLGTPNITSKGKLLPRNVLVPLALYPSEHPLHEDTNNTKKPLVEELEPRTKLVEDISNKLKLVEEVETKSKGILKSGPVTTQKKECPKFEWVKEGDKLKITVHVPKLRSTHIPNATLDLESRRIILDAAPFYSLDVDLSLSDAQIMSVSGGASSDNPALTLKRQRDLDVDNATAEWHVGEGVLVILA